jgi:trans-aconitate methyltransferase
VSSYNRQTDVYKEERELKYHELRMLELLRARFGAFRGSLLDVGCASGSFLAVLRQAFPSARLLGLDCDDTLLGIARERLRGRRVEIIPGDALDYRPPSPFDAIVASGVLSCFEDPLVALERWLSWLAPDGALFAFTCFNSADVDTRVRFRSRHRDHGWETGLTSYALRTVREFLERGGWKPTFERFELPIELERSEDPIRSFTLTLESGERIVTNGANVITELFFLTVERARRKP